MLSLCLKKGLLGMGITLFLSGCFSQINNYKTFYSSLENWNDYEVLLPTREVKREDVVLRPGTGNADIDDENLAILLEEGYVPLGVCSFYGKYCPAALLIDQAVDVGADLVWYSVVYRSTEAEVISIPTVSTTVSNTHGTTYGSASAYGSGGYAHASGFGSYSGTTTSTTYGSTKQTVYYRVYTHDAVFFRKGDFSKFYGVILEIPRRLPDETDDAPVAVRVGAVIKGSRAEKAGIRRGQRVIEINGREVKTHRDLQGLTPLSIRFVRTEK